MVVKQPSKERSTSRNEDASVELSSDEDERKPRFVYRYDGGSVELHLASLECLESDSSYLKDNIIQFYSAYLLHSVSDKSISSRVHIFDSFFSSQLPKVFRANKVYGARFKQVRKWYHKIDLFQKDFIVFPYCSSDHWFAIMACYPRNVADFPPGGVQTGVRKNIPGIVVLDSLGTSCLGHTQDVKDLLDFEWRTRCKTVKRFSSSDIQVYWPELPKQTNTHDCGLYMLAYIECLLENPDRFYQAVRSKETDRDVRKRIKEILKKNSRATLRKLIGKACEHK